MQLATLGDVIDAGQRGEMQRFQREGMNAQRQDMQRQQQAQGAYDVARQKAQLAAQGELSAGEDQKSAAMAGAEAYGRALMDAGDVQGYMQHEAKVQPLRLRMRQEAQQEFAVDKDKLKFMKRISSTMPNGQKIVGMEDVKGGPAVNRGTGPTAAPMQPKPTVLQGLAQFDQEMTDPIGAANAAPPLQEVIQPGLAGDGRLGAPSGLDKLRVRVLQNGKEDVRDVDWNGYLEGVRRLSMDPAKEIELNFREELARRQEATKAPNIVLRGDQTRQTGAQLAGFKKTQAEADAETRGILQTQKEEAALDQALQVAGVRGANSLAVAQVRSANKGGGGARSAAESLDLRAVQQSRIRLDGLRKEALRLLDVSVKNTYNKEEQAKMRARYDDRIAALDQEDAALKRRLDQIGAKKTEPAGSAKPADATFSPWR